jgi:hypothetical protein
MADFGTRKRKRRGDRRYKDKALNFPPLPDPSGITDSHLPASIIKHRNAEP